MLDNYKSIPFLAGICILFITPLSLGAFVYSSFRADSTDQSTDSAEDSTAKNDSLGGLTTESNIKTAPPLSEFGSGSSNTDSTTGIPTGKYSNSPTTIETGSEELIPQTSQEQSDNLGSSVDHNRAIQQTMNGSTNDSMDSLIPDYNTPASSNNYNDTQDNSLLEPLEDDSLLEAPESTSETAPLSPVTEPLSPSSPSSLSSPSSSSYPSQP